MPSFDVKEHYICLYMHAACPGLPRLLPIALNMATLHLHVHRTVYYPEDDEVWRGLTSD